MQSSVELSLMWEAMKHALLPSSLSDGSILICVEKPSWSYCHRNRIKLANLIMIHACETPLVVSSDFLIRRASRNSALGRKGSRETFHGVWQDVRAHGRVEYIESPTSDNLICTCDGWSRRQCSAECAIAYNE